MSEEDECVLLMDNGSLRAEATLQLRSLACGLARAIGRPVYPVSLLHASKVSTDALGGIPAETLLPFLRSKREAGVDRFLIIPLFFGNSEAFRCYMPERLAALRDGGWQALTVNVADPLASEEAGVLAVAEILLELVLELVDEKGWSRPAVAMVDHGTPVAEVNAVRQKVAQALARLLGENVSGVYPCSMERREGDAFDFNEPLLERLLGTGACAGEVVVAMMFLGPGRHAGAGGDVWQICEKAQRQNAGLSVAMTGLVGEKADRLVQLLEKKYENATHRVKE